MIIFEQVPSTWVQWNNWDLKTQILDVLHFHPYFPPRVWFSSFSSEIKTNLENAKNRTNLWVMTHDFDKIHTEIIAFPLRFCWFSWFSNKNQIISGNHHFFGKKGWIWRIVGFSTFFHNLSGNETILGKIIENFVNYAHQSELNLLLSAEMKRILDFFIFFRK